MKNTSLWAVVILLALALLVFVVAANRAESPTGGVELDVELPQ